MILSCILTTRYEHVLVLRFILISKRSIMYTYIYIYTHTYIHTYIHIYIQ
jgi:hypothetical protein